MTTDPLKIVVLIIAHNEEANIAGCIESLLSQTREPDEIILVNHNSTDKTSTIARGYPITVLDYQGPKGPVYARIRGLQEVSGDIVLCIDGDARAHRNWVEVMTNTLQKHGRVMVGSWIRISGILYFQLSSLFWYLVCTSRGQAADFMWGASFGLWIRDKEFVIRALEEGNALSTQLGLAYNPDDYWLALFMQQRGMLEITNKTWVTAKAKEGNSLQGIKRGFIARGIRTTMQKFLRANGLPKIAV